MLQMTQRIDLIVYKQTTSNKLIAAIVV